MFTLAAQRTPGPLGTAMMLLDRPFATTSNEKSLSGPARRRATAPLQHCRRIIVVVTGERHPPDMAPSITAVSF